MSLSIKTAYGNSPRAVVAFAVPPLRFFIPLRRRLLLVYVCGPTHCQTEAQLRLSCEVLASLLWRWHEGDYAICHLDDAASFFEKRSVPTVRFRRNAGSVQTRHRSQFLWQKNAMQPIQNRAIILNTLLRRLTFATADIKDEDEASPATPPPP